MVDSIDNVKILVGQDIMQDIDMSRKEFVDKLLAGAEEATGRPEEAQCRSHEGQ